MKKNILVYLCFFIGLFIISILYPVELDGIWGYGFSYNISQGLIPYKDFNMVIGPLYSIIFSIPMRLFGNYFYLFEIEHIFFYSFIFTALYNKFGKKSIFMLLLYSSCLTMFGYNLFCVMMLITILLFLDSNIKYKQIFIGIIIGMILMTKHNIGLFLLVVYIYDNRKHLLNLLSVLIPVVPIIIYLMVNNVFNSYIDFAYLGMGNFLTNLSTDFVSAIPYAIFMIPVIKDFIKKRTIQLAYILAFQIVIFPIFDQGHIIPAFITIMYYLFTIDNKKLQFYMNYFTIIGFIVMIIIKPVLECEFIVDDNYLKFQRTKNGINKYLKNYSNYLDRLDDGEIYLLVDNAYIIRLYRNENPSFYDLINKGNLGSDDNKYLIMIDDNCKDKKCYFILDNGFYKPKLFDQRNTIFKRFVEKKYKYVETLPSKDRLYVNK